jgi:hypothetical protein
MKRLFALALLLLGSVGIAGAQVTVPIVSNDRGNVAQDFAATSAAKATLLDALAAADTVSLPTPRSSNTFSTPSVVTALALPREDADPASPAPTPRFLYGGREDYRWELGLAFTWMRFQSSIVNASLVGLNTSVTYFTNEWFAIEGGISATVAPTILANEHVKILTFGVGPKIAWRQKQFEPWMHALIGGAHEQPQFAGVGRNGYAIKAGAGVDYRWNPRLSFRVEADYVRTGFFSQSQNGYQVAGGIVFHF